MLAAGAYGSPGILLRSEIQGLPVGDGLIDHVGVGLGFEATERLQRETAEFERSHALAMAQVTIEARSSRCAEGVCDLFLFPAIDPPGPGRLRDQRGGVRDEARVARARAPDVAGPAGAAGDRPRLPARGARRRGDRRGRRGDARAGGERRRPPLRRCARRDRGRTSTASLTPAPPRAASSTRSARARSAAWSTGPGCVLGHEGLVVADASIMPTIPRANTNLSTLAVAERVAELLSV